MGNVTLPPGNAASTAYPMPRSPATEALPTVSRLPPEVLDALTVDQPVAAAGSAILPAGSGTLPSGNASRAVGNASPSAANVTLPADGMMQGAGNMMHATGSVTSNGNDSIARRNPAEGIACIEMPSELTGPRIGQRGNITWRPVVREPAADTSKQTSIRVAADPRACFSPSRPARTDSPRTSARRRPSPGPWDSTIRSRNTRRARGRRCHGRDRSGPRAASAARW